MSDRRNLSPERGIRAWGTNRREPVQRPPVDVRDVARTCRRCGCDNLHGCQGGCSWVEWDLCSACAGREAKA